MTDDAIKCAIVGLWLSFGLCVSCSSLKQPADCSDASLAALEVAYVTEAVSACKAEGSDYEHCRVLADVRERYRARRAAYVECSR